MKYIISEKDYTKAIPLLKKAYKSRGYRHPGSAFQLGCLYYFGKGTETNKFEAYKWFLRSGEAELAEAQFYLFWSYSYQSRTKKKKKKICSKSFVHPLF